MPSRCASATAIFSLRGSMMKTAEGSCSIALMPTSAFWSFSRSRSSSSASIFGFHRLVWWPKCTPASSNSFIVNVAMTPPSVCLRRATGLVCARPKARGVRDGGLRRVFGVDPHVLLAEVTGPDAVLAAAEAQVDRDLVLSPSHDLPDALQAHPFPQHAALDEPLAAEGDGHLVLLHPR